MSLSGKMVGQCRKPTGWFGRFIARRMNAWHSKLTDWGLSQISISPDAIILDIGCGGGETIRKLAKLAQNGRIFGVDHSADSVATARKTNAELINAGRVQIQQGSVSQLPFYDGQFDLVTAVETHFFWPDLTNDVREVIRVLKPGGTFIVIAEVYKGSTTLTGQLAQKYIDHSGMRIMSIDEHRDMLEQAGFRDVRITTSASKGWISAIGNK